MITKSGRRHGLCSQNALLLSLGTPLSTLGNAAAHSSKLMLPREKWIRRGRNHRSMILLVAQKTFVRSDQLPPHVRVHHAQKSWRKRLAPLSLSLSPPSSVDVSPDPIPFCTANVDHRSGITKVQTATSISWKTQIPFTVFDGNQVFPSPHLLGYGALLLSLSVGIYQCPSISIDNYFLCPRTHWTNISVLSLFSSPPSRSSYLLPRRIQSYEDSHIPDH